MATIINASNSSGLIQTADTSGILQLQTNGVTALQIDGSQNVTFTNSPSASSMTLLTTINTTSGTTITSSTISLTSYKQVLFVFNGVSNSGTTGNFTMTDPNATTFNLAGWAGNATQSVTGNLIIDLSSGVVFGGLRNNTSTSLPDVNNTSNAIIGKTTFSTSTTTFTFNASAGAFDAGSILVYGVK